MSNCSRICSMLSMISPSAKGVMALAMIHEAYAFMGAAVSPLAYKAPFARDHPNAVLDHDPSVSEILALYWSLGEIIAITLRTPQ